MIQSCVHITQLRGFRLPIANPVYHRLMLWVVGILVCVQEFQVPAYTANILWWCRTFAKSTGGARAIIVLDDIGDTGIDFPSVSEIVQIGEFTSDLEVGNGEFIPFKGRGFIHGRIIILHAEDV